MPPRLVAARVSHGGMAMVWLFFCLGLAAHQVHLWRAAPWDTDILALLPPSGHAADDAVVQDLLHAATQDVMVLVGAPEWDAARKAASVVQRSVSTADVGLVEKAAADTHVADWVAFYRPYRDRLLTAEQRQNLQNVPVSTFVEQALAAVYQPMGGPRLTSWREDPLGLWPMWWQARADATRLHVRDGVLSVHDGATWYVALPFVSQRPAFHLNGTTSISTAIERARAAAMAAVPQASVFAAGVPLYAEAAAAQASWEVNTIGWGSLVAVMLLVWLAFRSLRPIALVGMSLAIGCAAGLSCTVLLYGRVHIITLVFGSTLIGVAEDFGIHYFAARQGQPAAARWRLLRRHLPGLSLAMVTSVLSYLAIGLAPFPGLRQMALFSATGIAAAFGTVVCWFPWLDGGDLPATAFCTRIAANLARWPRWDGRRIARFVAWLLGLASLAPFMLHTHDDIRSLQNTPAPLLAQQRQVSVLLGLPSPAQFFVVQADTPEAVLEREEALTAALVPLVTGGELSGWRAVSDWIPSPRRQRADAALTARVENAVLQAVGAITGNVLQRPAFAPAPLTLQAWQAAAAGRDPTLGLWRGRVGDHFTSVVQLAGLHSAAPLARLAAINVPGVRFVDKTAELSGVLQRYRAIMTILLVCGYGAVSVVLLLRFRMAAWRALLPTAAASLLTLGMLGAAGQPVQLFNILALLLVLGIGVDYGIFLLEDHGAGTAWVAVVIGAASTWLSFGLLALSATPALRAFGLTLFSGIGWVWLLTPLFRLAPDARPP